MADAKKREYGSYGNAAYAPGYDGTAARRLEREEVLLPRPKAYPRERAQVRPRVQVREQEHISIFAVVGFLAVGIFAALVLMSYVSLTTLSVEKVELQTELSTLKSEESKLLAKYELAYDLKTIEETVTASGAMVKPQSGQIYTVDLSEPDSIDRYQKEEATAGVSGAFSAVREVFLTIVEYFR